MLYELIMEYAQCAWSLRNQNLEESMLGYACSGLQNENVLELNKPWQMTHL